MLQYKISSFFNICLWIGLLLSTPVWQHYIIPVHSLCTILRIWICMTIVWAWVPHLDQYNPYLVTPLDHQFLLYPQLYISGSFWVFRVNAHTKLLNHHCGCTRGCDKSFFFITEESSSMSMLRPTCTARDCVSTIWYKLNNNFSSMVNAKWLYTTRTRLWMIKIGQTFVTLSACLNGCS